MIDTHKFVEWLERISTDRGVMSDLRKGLREDTTDRAWPHITHVCDITRFRDELVTRVIAGLYATHPQHSDDMGNFGRSLQMLAYRRKDPELKIHERYLSKLTGARDVKDVVMRLPFLVRMMKNEGIPINFDQLYQDVFFWNLGKTPDRAKREWCKGYYQRKGGDGVSDEDTNTEA